LWARLRFIGPGIILAAAAIGSGELILTPRAGALYGLSIAWVIVLSIIYKMTLTVGLARYTIATGEDIFRGFSRLPGPRLWFVWVLSLLFLVGAVGYSGIALACGSALFALFPSLSMVQWAVVVVVLAYALLLGGSYGPVEKVTFVLSLILILGVVYNLSALRPGAGWFLRGLAPDIPAGSGRTVISLLGWTAGGASTLVYSFWILEKGIGLRGKDRVSLQKGRNSPAVIDRMQSWMSIIRLDIGLSYVLMIVVSLAFLTIGVLVLRTAGPAGGPLIPAREETTLILSRLLTTVAGPQARFVFLIAALAILLSTIIGLVDGKSRALRTGVKMIFIRSSRISDVSLYRLFVTVMCAIIFAFLFTGRPVVLIVLISALEAPMLALSAVMLVYLLYKKLPQAFHPSRWWLLVMVVGTILYLAFSSLVFVQILQELF
jgi:Mn2+/Fe2+ NRAMP family transporter